jgi:hypothetical protein
VSIAEKRKIEEEQWQKGRNNKFYCDISALRIILISKGSVYTENVIM